MIRRMSWLGGLAVMFGLSLSAAADEPAGAGDVALEDQVRQLREQLQSLEQAMAAQQAAQSEVRTRQTSLIRRLDEEASADAVEMAEAASAGCRAGGCFQDQCDNGWMHCFDDDKWVKVGAGIRTSFRSRERVGSDAARQSNDFNIDNARIYISGQGHPLFGFELNTDINNAQGFDFPANPPGQVGGESFVSGEVRILDAVIKMKVTDHINIWAGRFLPPSDRSNLSGPYYLNSWLFPYTQFGFNNQFQGRDDGVAAWGQYGDGAFKWQAGVFDGENVGGPQPVGHPQNDSLMFAARLTANLLDPEPGYYNSSTYYGEKDILALGWSILHRPDHLQGATGTTTNYTAWNLDFLWEQQLGDCGVVSVEAAYYDIDDENGTVGGAAIANPTGIFGDAANRQGESWFLLASYLAPWDIPVGCLNGRMQVQTRYQQYDHDIIMGAGGGVSDQIDVQLNYIMEGHNARISALWTRHDAAANGRDDLDAFIIGSQLQF